MTVKAFCFATSQNDSIAGTAVVRIRAGIQSKASLLQTLATQLHFPDYFGYNWDALDECLGDLSWLDVAAVDLYHEDVPLSNRPEEARAYLEVLQGVSSEPGKVVVRATFPPDVRANVEELLST